MKTTPTKNFARSFSVLLIAALMGLGVAAEARETMAFATNGLPLLHSDPDAAGVIFVDFDGADWGSNYRGPYGGDLVFDEVEQAEIIDAWRDLSVYFAMFDIDVTTEQPDKTLKPTAHVVVSPDQGNGSANLGLFGANDTPNRARGATSAEFASSRTTGIAHEIGHIMGCGHQSIFDSEGNRTEAYRVQDEYNQGAMMGLDFRGKYAQWWDGLTAGPTPQNDIELIRTAIVTKALEFTGGTYAGDGFRSDDHPSGIAGAHFVRLADLPSPPGTHLVGAEARGVIERYDDIDEHQFNWLGGAVTCKVEAVKALNAAHTYASSLSPTLALVDESGRILAGSLPTDTADVEVALATNLAEGTYYLSIGGAGEHGDLGTYELTISGSSTESSPYRRWASATDLLRQYPHLSDPGQNADGDRLINLEEFAYDTDPTSMETRAKQSVTYLEESEGELCFVITLPMRRDAVFRGASSQTATTDGLDYEVKAGTTLDALAGRVEPLVDVFHTGLPALARGWEYRSFCYEAAGASQQRGYLSVGVREAEPPATVSGHLFVDTNGNGIQDEGEPDLANVDVDITDTAGTQTVTTDASGNYTAVVQPGSVTADVDDTDPDIPGPQTAGTDPSVVTAVAGINTSAGVDGFQPPPPRPLAGQLSVFDPLNANGGINPQTGVAWAEGDRYRLAFYTEDKRDALSNDMADYNAFVQSVAAGSTAFPSLSNGTWKVLGSTATVSARQNTGTETDDNLPIFVLDGVTMIAQDSADMWDGFPVRYDAASSPNGQQMIYSPYLNEQGEEIVEINFGREIATGATFSGGISGDPLGDPDNDGQRLTVGASRPNTASRVWARFGNRNPGDNWSFYALSEPLMVVTVDPPQNLATRHPAR